MRRPTNVANPARLGFCRRCHTGHWLAGALPNAGDPDYLCAGCRQQVREETPWCPDDVAGGVHRDGCSCESAAPKMSALPRPAAGTGEGGSVAASALPGPLAEARP